MHQEAQEVFSIDIGTALTLLAMAFAAWATVVAYGIRFMKSGITDMRDTVLADLSATKQVVTKDISELEKHMFKELTDMRVQLTKTSETQNIHINQTERRLTMLETEFQFVKAHMFNHTNGGKRAKGAENE